MRKIVTSKTFDKKFVKLTSKNESLFKDIIITLELLSVDINDSKLKTHKLVGNLKEFYASSINYSYRIIFQYDNSSVYLETLGDHDEVY